jgi:carbon storage regulator
MLIIARKKGETIRIGDDVEIVILELSRTVAKVAISAPRGTPVLRGEIFRAVREANEAAASAPLPEGPARLEPVRVLSGAEAARRSRNGAPVALEAGVTPSSPDKPIREATVPKGPEEVPCPSQ